MANGDVTGGQLFSYYASQRFAAAQHDQVKKVFTVPGQEGLHLPQDDDDETCGGIPAAGPPIAAGPGGGDETGSGPPAAGPPHAAGPGG